MHPDTRRVDDDDDGECTRVSRALRALCAKRRNPARQECVSVCVCRALCYNVKVGTSSVCVCMYARLCMNVSGWAHYSAHTKHTATRRIPPSALYSQLPCSPAAFIHSLTHSPPVRSHSLRVLCLLISEARARMHSARDFMLYISYRI